MNTNRRYTARELLERTLPEGGCYWQGKCAIFWNCNDPMRGLRFNYRAPLVGISDITHEGTPITRSTAIDLMAQAIEGESAHKPVCDESDSTHKAKQEQPAFKVGDRVRHVDSWYGGGVVLSEQRGRFSVGFSRGRYNCPPEHLELLPPAPAMGPHDDEPVIVGPDQDSRTIEVHGQPAIDRVRKAVADALADAAKDIEQFSALAKSAGDKARKARQLLSEMREVRE